MFRLKQADCLTLNRHLSLILRDVSAIPKAPL